MGGGLPYKGLLKALGLPIPKVIFSIATSLDGDLVQISKLPNYQLKNDDTWEFAISHKYKLERRGVKDGKSSAEFGEQEVVINSNPLANMKVWIVGDSFTRALKPYFEATFKEIHYLGHWSQHLPKLSNYLENTSEKPDLVVIVKVERSF